MTHITKLTEIVGGRLLPSDKKLSASLLEVGGRLSITGDTLGFDSTGIATETYVSDAILAAQLSKEEVDLSGYATKTDLEDYTTIEGTQLAVSSYVDYAIADLTPRLDLKVDKVEGKGLSTNDYTDADKAKVDGIDTSISTAVNAAIASVVDNAPATFDTLKEIATWIETEGVDTADLAAGIAGKADRTELSDYATVVSMTQLEGQVSDGLSNKVDKEAGKGLSTEDFTTAYKTKLDDIDNQKLDIPTSVSSSTITTPTVNSIPLYTLGNNGDYVLCTPDAWLNINGFLVPGYSATTLGV